MTTDFQRTNRGIQSLREYHYYPDAMLDTSKMRGKHVLDIGCGDGKFVTDLRTEGIEAEGLDIHLNEDQKKLGYFIQGDAIGTQLSTASYDLIYSTVSIFAYERNNLTLLTQLLTEASRILKPGGQMRISPSSAKNIAEAIKKVPNLKVISHRFID